MSQWGDSVSTEEEKQDQWEESVWEKERGWELRELRTDFNWEIIVICMYSNSLNHASLPMVIEP